MLLCQPKAKVLNRPQAKVLQAHASAIPADDAPTIASGGAGPIPDEDTPKSASTIVSSEPGQCPLPAVVTAPRHHPFKGGGGLPRRSL